MLCVFGTNDEADIAALPTLNNLIHLDRIHLNSQFSERSLPED